MDGARRERGRSARRATRPQAEIVIKLKQQEVTYQAALAVTARTLQPTLMDFLR